MPAKCAFGELLLTLGMIMGTKIPLWAIQFAILVPLFSFFKPAYTDIVWFQRYGTTVIPQALLASLTHANVTGCKLQNKWIYVDIPL